jgi:hypothetical protein
VGRNDAGVLRDGKTSFSGNKSMRGVVGRGLPLAKMSRFFFTSSFVRLLGRRFEAVLCANSDGATAGRRLLGLEFAAPSSCLFSRSSAHSSAASKYAGERDGLVFRPPLLVSPTCSNPSAITARLPATCLPRWPDFLGMAGLTVMLVVAVADMAGGAGRRQGYAVTGEGAPGGASPCWLA